ncbi:sulfur carrier protein ThiS [Ideonella dechloratans]|uniref:Sulfur carrier protein ThiS n=1 Tax=Ideonella dechloratans TaxID=36863 RepID=A0A643F4M1_IDEDE|nr:sulfur carrier protein ThiS [Ideonella dechloratans]KAB0572101.1 sulfur carrier protein ThiS [Ideonella dechloratans]UFU10445.1 sulfur carrier protein ThiS [Ideonella dechloratans]
MPETTPTVTLNGEPRPWRPGLSLADLLATEGLTPEAVASAVNAFFVPRDQRAATLLQPGDEIALFQAIVGG